MTPRGNWGGDGGRTSLGRPDEHRDPYDFWRDALPADAAGARREPPVSPSSPRSDPPAIPPGLDGATPPRPAPVRRPRKLTATSPGPVWLAAFFGVGISGFLLLLLTGGGPGAARGVASSRPGVRASVPPPVVPVPRSPSGKGRRPPSVG